MHSKWQIWDFFKKFPTVLMRPQGLYSFNTFDPLVGMLLKNKILANYGDREVKTVVADKITPDWIEDNLQTLGLFGNTESYIFQSCDELSKQSVAQITDSELLIDDRFLVCIGYKDSHWKDIFKLEGQHHTIEAPKFWEFNRLLDFLIDELELRLDLEAKGYILHNINHSISDFWNALNLLKINFSHGQSLNINHVREILETSRFDQFELASLYSKKQLPKFYSELVRIDPDLKSLSRFFSFMQGHLIKIEDPSYCQNRPRLSKYDKEIQMASKLWKKEELIGHIKRFSELEILAREKSATLSSRLNKYTLQSYQF